MADNITFANGFIVDEINKLCAAVGSGDSIMYGIELTKIQRPASDGVAEIVVKLRIPLSNDVGNAWDRSLLNPTNQTDINEVIRSRK